MSRLFIMSILALCGVIVSIDAQDTLPESPPVVLIEYNTRQILTWTPENGLSAIATLPDGENAPPILDNRMVYHVDSGYFFYTTIPEIWWESLSDGLLPDDTRLPRDVYRVDAYTGEVKPFATQHSDNLEDSIERWALHISPDGGRLMWLEDDGTVDLVIADIVTGEEVSRTALDGIQLDIPLPEVGIRIMGMVDDYIVITFENALFYGGPEAYIILNRDGTIRHLSTTPLTDRFYHYVFEDEGAMYYGTPTERVSLDDNTRSNTPTGTLFLQAAHAPESSMRLDSTHYTPEEGCISALVSPSGESVDNVRMQYFMRIFSFAFSPDGRELVYYDWDTENGELGGDISRRYLTHIVLGDDDVPEITTYDLPDEINVVGMHWGDTRTVLQRSDNPFRGNFFCGMG